MALMQSGDAKVTAYFERLRKITGGDDVTNESVCAPALRYLGTFPSVTAAEQAAIGDYASLGQMYSNYYSNCWQGISDPQARAAAGQQFLSQVGDFNRAYMWARRDRIDALLMPAALTAVCMDGTYSYSAHDSGTCSYHGGVRQWFR